MSDIVDFKPPQVKLNIPLLTSIPVLIIGGLIATVFFFWFFCRIEPGTGQIAVLIRKTGDDMLECKNFGVTSLNEVREKLTELSLKLRGD